jgi:single-strand DNA-binding protein
MADSLNKVMLIGNVGNDPEIVEFANGILASFSLATSHSWFDNKTNERKTNTDWHRIVVYGEGLVGIIKKINIQKSTKLFIEGKLVTRKWEDKNGNPRTTVEVVLQGYNCSLIVLTPNNNGNAGSGFRKDDDNNNKYKGKTNNEFDEWLKNGGELYSKIFKEVGGFKKGTPFFKKSKTGEIEFYFPEKNKYNLELIKKYFDKTQSGEEKSVRSSLNPVKADDMTLKFQPKDEAILSKILKSAKLTAGKDYDLSKQKSINEELYNSVKEQLLKLLKK